MLNLIQIALIIIGPFAWFITKNKRWAILSLAGIAWFIYDVLVLYSQMGG